MEGGTFSVPIIDTIENYTWEGSLLDCSIGETVWATMPATYLQARTNVRMIVAGPSWVDEMGQVVATCQQSSSNRWHGDYWFGLYARKDWLEQFLNRQGLALALTGKLERRLRDGGDTYAHRHLEVWSGAVLRADGALVEAGKPIRAEGPQAD